jgi:hypothetical protein
MVIAQKTMSYLGVSSHFAKRALDEITVYRQAQTRAQALVPDTLAGMRKQALVADHEVKDAEAMLGSHEGSLAIVKLAVDRIAVLRAELAKQAAELQRLTGKKPSSDVGGATDPAKVGVDRALPTFDSLHDPYPGRPTMYKKASDEALAGILDDPRA